MCYSDKRSSLSTRNVGDEEENVLRDWTPVVGELLGWVMAHPSCVKLQVGPDWFGDALVRFAKTSSWKRELLL